MVLRLSGRAAAFVCRARADRVGTGRLPDRLVRYADPQSTQRLESPNWPEDVSIMTRRASSSGAPFICRRRPTRHVGHVRRRGARAENGLPDP